LRGRLHHSGFDPWLVANLQMPHQVNTYRYHRTVFATTLSSSMGLNDEGTGVLRAH
jgi:hypothetical protein